MATVLIFDQSAPSAAISENATINARERQKSLMLRAWIVSGLFFMALPGTLLGFSNLMAISAHHGLGTLPAAWMEGHGHAQMFGWIGSFILGIGFYSQPTHGRVGHSSASVLLPPMDIRRRDALVREHLWMAMAHSSPTFCGIRACRGDSVSLRSLSP